MTKKILLGAMATAMLFATSCSNEIDVVTPTDGEATVTVGLSIPQKQMGSRAFSDGTTAEKLQYAVYEKDGSTLSLLEGMSKTGDAAVEIKLQTQIPFRLLNDHTYVFVFWAANEDAPYTVDFGKTGEVIMTANYDNISANDETLDAFYTVKEIKVTGSTKMEAELYRPFAQINIGTNDLKDMADQKHAVKEVQVVVSDVYTKLDLMSGYVSDAKEVTFKSAVLPQGETFPVSGYDYLAMNYVLVGQENDQDEAQKLVTVNFTATNEVVGETTNRIVGYVPIQRNYRTNIFGQIFTSDIDLNVTIVPDYMKPDYNYDQLLLAAQVGGSVTLTDDVELPAGEVVRFVKDAVLDMNGKTIKSPVGKDGAITVLGSNLTITGNGTFQATDDNHCTLVWADNGGTVTIENGTFTADGNDDQMIYIGENGGTINIKGGTFHINDDPNFTLNCYDPAFRNGTAKFVVTGGTFYNFDPSHSTADFLVGENFVNWVPEGYKVVMRKEGADKIYTVVPADTDVIDVTSSMTQDDFNAAINGAADKAIINLGDAVELKLPANSLVGKTFTFVGNGENSVINGLNHETATGANLTFENMTLQVAKGGSNTSLGFNGAESISLKDVTVKGEFHTFTAKTANFDGCTFVFDEVNTVDRQGIWCEAYGTTVISNCTFDITPPEGNGNETKAILIYSDNNKNMGDVEVTKCTFKGGRVSAKAAVEIHSEKFESAGTLTITGCTYDANIYLGGLWREIYNVTDEKHTKGDKTTFYTVFVDGVEQNK